MYKTFADAAQAIRPALHDGYTICHLTKDDIPDFLTLQTIVRNGLPDHQKHHLKERSRQDLEDHLNAGMPALGVKTPFGELVGQMLMSFPANEAAKNLEGYPLNGIEQETAIVQSLAVKVNHNGIAQKLFAMGKRVIEDQGFSFMMAKVADSNVMSQNSFLRGQFADAKKGIDPNKGYGVTYFLWESANGCAAASQSLALRAKIA